MKVTLFSFMDPFDNVACVQFIVKTGIEFMIYVDDSMTWQCEILCACDIDNGRKLNILMSYW